MSSTVVMTGKTGFIGSHLATLLSRSGYTVYGLVREKQAAGDDLNIACSLTDQARLDAIFAGLQPDYFLHLASLVQPGRDWSTLEEQYKNTVLPSVTIARALPETTKLAIFFGSCEEYGNSAPPFYEDQAVQCFSPYGWAKISSYYAVSGLMQQRQIPFSWARPFLTFGPGQKPKNLIPWLIDVCLKNQTMPLTPGEQTRDLIYVDDVCRMVLAMLQNPERASGKTLNLCSGIPRRIRDVAETVAGLVGSGSLNFGALPYRADEAMSFYGSPERFNSLFGTPQLTPFAEALTKTIDSYRSL